MSAPGVSLVVGGDGQIGRALVGRLAASGARLIATTRREGTRGEGRIFLDLAGEVSRWSPPEDVTVAYLCAAAATLHQCREDPAGTRRLNVEALWTVAKALLRRDAFVVFTSTNLVYDGTIPFRRAEEPVSPVTEYGRQKAEMERRLLAWTGPTAVVRLTKVLGPDWPLLRGWAQALRQGEVIRPFSDMVLPPVSVGFVAEVLLRVGEGRVAGIVQVSGGEDVPYEQLARRLAAHLGADAGLVQPIPSSASRLALEAAPRYSALDTSRLREELDLEPPDVWETIDEVLSKVATEAAAGGER